METLLHWILLSVLMCIVPMIPACVGLYFYALRAEQRHDADRRRNAVRQYLDGMMDDA